MIYDKIENIELYRGLSKNFDLAIDFIKRTRLSELENGRNEVDGENIYCNCFEGELMDDGVYEAHERYIDIHLPILGRERVCVTDRKSLAITEEYDTAGDCLLGSGESHCDCILSEGEFLATFPCDAHMPMRKIGCKAGTIKKAVMKVACN